MAATVTYRETPVAAAVTHWEMPENGGENLQSVKTHFQASQGNFTISEVPFSLEEVAQMAAMIARGGKGKTEIVQAMSGYSGRKHKAHAACYDRLRAAIGAESDSSDSA